MLVPTAPLSENRIALNHTQRLEAVQRRQQQSPSMSDTAEVEVENPSGYMVLPKEVTEEIGSIKLFNKWSYEDVEVRDISLT